MTFPCTKAYKWPRRKRQPKDIWITGQTMDKALNLHARSERLQQTTNLIIFIF